MDIKIQYYRLAGSINSTYLFELFKNVDMTSKYILIILKSRNGRWLLQPLSTLSDHWPVGMPQATARVSGHADAPVLNTVEWEAGRRLDDSRGTGESVVSRALGTTKKVQNRGDGDVAHGEPKNYACVDVKNSTFRIEGDLVGWSRLYRNVRETSDTTTQ